MVATPGTYRHFLTNLFSVYASSIINGILGVAAIPLVINALGKEQYGLFSIYLIIASYVALVDCGVTKHFVRLMASATEREYQNSCLQKAFGWYLILCALLLAALPGLIYLVVHFAFPVPAAYRISVQWIVVLAVVEYVLAVPTFLSISLTVANEQFVRLSKYNIVTGLYRYGLMFFAALVFKNPVLVVLFVVMRRVIDIVCARYLLLRLDREVWRPSLEWREFIRILGTSSILSLSQFIQITIVSIGSVLVNRFFGISALGFYRAAFELSSKVWLLSNGIGMLVYPKFSKIIATSANMKSFAEELYFLLGKSWLVYLTIAAVAAALAESALPLIGLNSQQIIVFFTILILGTCMNAHANIAYEFLLAAGKYRLVAAVSTAVLLVLSGCFVALTPTAGVYAIAWAWLISQLCYAMTADELMLWVRNGKRKQALPAFKGLVFLLTLGVVLDVLFLGSWYTRYLLLGTILLSGYLYFRQGRFFAFQG